MYLNGEELYVDIIEPVFALDENPDLDGYEVVFPTDEDIIGKENFIEIAFSDPELFQPFRISMLLISTGAIPDPKE